MAAVMLAQVLGDLVDGVGGGDVEPQRGAPTRLAVSASASAADSTSIATTRAPSRANTSAIVAPMPRAAPVTMATLPSSGRSQSPGGVESASPT